METCLRTFLGPISAAVCGYVCAIFSGILPAFSEWVALVGICAFLGGLVWLLVLLAAIHVRPEAHDGAREVPDMEEAETPAHVG